MIIEFKKGDNKDLSVVRVIHVLAAFNKNSLEEMIPLIENYREKGVFSIELKEETSSDEIESAFYDLKYKYTLY